MFKTVTLWIPLALLCLAVSCAQDPTSAAQKILTQQCSTLSSGHLKVTNFTKQDAVMSNLGGVEQYTVKYSLEVEGVQDGAYVHLCDSESQDAPLHDFEVRRTPCQPDCFVFPVQRGRKYHFSETGFTARNYTHELTLSKHESGWVVEDPMTFATVRPSCSGD
jgi:hypothetical protein